MAAPSSQTLDRGLSALRLIAASAAPVPAVELATALGVTRPTVDRLLDVLEAHALVRRESDGCCRLGFGILDVTQHIPLLLRSAVSPPLRQLAEGAGATAHLTVVDGDQAVAVAVVEPSWTDRHVAYRIGSRHDLTRGAAGRAILAGRQPVRAVDYVLSAGELELEAHGVAAPVRGVPGLEASVGVVTLGALDARVIGPAVVAAAEEVTAALS